MLYEKYINASILMPQQHSLVNVLVKKLTRTLSSLVVQTKQNNCYVCRRSTWWLTMTRRRSRTVRRPGHVTSFRRWTSTQTACFPRRSLSKDVWVTRHYSDFWPALVATNPEPWITQLARVAKTRISRVTLLFRAEIRLRKGGPEYENFFLSWSPSFM